MEKIAVFHPSNDLYGADRILVYALQSFPESSKKIIYLPKEGPLTDLILSSVKNTTVIIEPRIPIIYRALFSPKGIWNFMKNYFRFKRFIRKEHREHHFDLGYVNTLSCAFLLPILSQLKIKNFVHVHEIIEHPKFVAQYTAKLANKSSDYVVCVSNAVKNNLTRIVPELAKKSYCLHNGIKPIQVKESKRNELLTFYLFGRIMPKKGQWYLLEALSHLSKETLEKAHFVIVGGPPPGKEHLSASLNEKIQELNLDGAVTLKGFCSDISSEMSNADVCVVPSLMKDPFPTTVLEAMSSNKPVIATNHGGSVEVIADGENGFLIPPNDSQEFARVLDKMIQNRSSVAEMGDQAKQLFEESFTLEVFQGKWLSLHTRLT